MTNPLFPDEKHGFCQVVKQQSLCHQTTETIFLWISAKNARLGLSVENPGISGR
jgi:hypothetical protein